MFLGGAVLEANYIVTRTDSSSLFSQQREMRFPIRVRVEFFPDQLGHFQVGIEWIGEWFLIITV